MHNNVRKITEGALMCALIGVLLVLNLNFAYAFEAFFIVLMPIPLIIYIIKYDFKSSLVVFISCIILSFLLGTLTTVIYTLMSMILGLVYGAGIKKNDSSFVLIFKSICVTMVLEFSVFVFFTSLFGIDPTTEINTYIHLFADLMNLDPSFAQTLAYSLFLISTGLVAINEAVIVHMLSLILIKRLKLMERKVRSVFDMKLNKGVALLGFILIICMSFILFLPINDIIKTILVSLGLISEVVLMFYGFVAIVYVYWAFYHKNVTITLVILCLILLPISVILLPFIGFIYNITDFKSIVLEVMNGKK